MSGLYSLSEGPVFFDNNLTGGQIVCRVVHQIIYSAKENVSLAEILRRATVKLAEINEKAKIPSERTDLLPGAAFALAKIEKDYIAIIQGGDCFALWTKADGTFGITENQLFRYDMETRRIIAELMEKHCGDREKMWREFVSILSSLRQEHVNKKGRLGGYALLNGQNEIENHWKLIALRRSDVSSLMLFTDGLIYYPESGEPETFAREILNDYQKGGLAKILKSTRQKEEKVKLQSHIDFAEATVVVVQL